MVRYQLQLQALEGAVKLKLIPDHFFSFKHWKGLCWTHNDDVFVQSKVEHHSAAYRQKSFELTPTNCLFVEVIGR